MKKVSLFIICFLFIIGTTAVFAQSGTATATDSGFTINLGTFTGIVALVSAIVTEFLKVIPSVKDSKLTKIIISIVAGLAVCIVAWFLHLTPLLEGMQWWQALIYGLAAGLSGCGFFDVVKAISGIVGKNKLPVE